MNLKKIARPRGHPNTERTGRYIHPTDDVPPAATEIAATEIAAQARRTTIVPEKLRQVG